MPSTLGWLDHDPHERERTTRILALFKERNAVDELGLGGIRDSFADQLFPGTSTIQTRLRYMLFVPWVYQRLEDDRVPSADVARKARRLETELVEPLLDAEEEGVLGRLARGDLKRLPSSVYWNGLLSWGIRRFEGSQEHYHRSFDRLHALRAAAQRRDDNDVHEAPKLTWDPGLPPAPDSFPQGISFALRRVEAEYLRDRICAQHPGSLLAWTAKDPEPVPEVEFLWQHPRFARFSAEHRELVHHARLFAEVMSGAAVLYNLELARKRAGGESGDARERAGELVRGHATSLQEWVVEMTAPEVRKMLRDWSVARLWELVINRGHQIGPRTREFVEAWVKVALAGSLVACDSEAARNLIRARERALKGSASRFDNQRALDQWSGYAGLGVLDYRWFRVKTLLRDLQDGLQRSEEG